MATTTTTTLWISVLSPLVCNKCKISQDSLSNAKVSARQPWYIERNSLNWPPLRIAQQYQHNLYIVEKYFQCATIPSLTMRFYLHSFSRCCLPNMPTSTKFRENLNLQQFKVIQGQWFWYQSKVHMRLPTESLIVTLVLSWPFLRYGNLVAENFVFFIPLPYLVPCSLFPLEFRSEIKRQETRVMGLLCGEDCMILTSTIFDWTTRGSDRWTGDSI